ncbi:hypothetical protein E5554_16770 [Sphingobium sp. PAMC28499]|jgi:hypothetical protein|uniref:DUF6538 domain-containing protein n=1 Tax=Sphingobium sp. PAMC28499 TaxID=2565554 RepID=UPI00109D82DD|nr:DUF6538 domain-containing protein [Sphingobium sp. PAMC28499]QCB39334.1 hypothetical protein E5554_16770 [Sphingobium sp. PAMC28499]
MSTRLLFPLKRKNSSQYRFRMVVPPHYRGQVGNAEIKQPLCTDDLGEARRLGTAHQYDWLKKFELIKLGLKARDTLAGTDAIDGYLADCPSSWAVWTKPFLTNAMGSLWPKQTI